MSGNWLDSESGQLFSVRRSDPLNPDTVPGILLQGLLTLFGLSLGLFALTRLVPGGPCAAYYGDRYSLSATQHTTCVARFGLGQSGIVQYLLTIGGYLRGDLGFSNNGVPIWNTITNQFPDTVLLVGGAVVLQTLFAILAGVTAARRRGTRIDTVILAVTESVAWIPPIWLAWLLITILVIGLNWLPMGAGDNRLPIFWSGQWFRALPHDPGLLLGDQVLHLVIPLAAIVLPGAAVSTRVVRDVVVATVQHPAVRTAHAAGVQPSAFILRLVLLGLLESAGPLLATLLGTAGVVGALISLRGDEAIFWSVASNDDWGMLLTLLLLGSLVVFLVSLGTRLLRVRLDPSLRGDQPSLPATPRSSFILDLWWIVPVPELPAPVMRRGSGLLLAIGLGIVALVAALAIFAPLIAPGGSPTNPIIVNPGAIDVPPRLALPGTASWPLLLGTDRTGKPVLNWMVYGARSSLLVGALGAIGAVGLGSLLGILATISRPVGVIVGCLSRVVQTVPPLPLLAVLTAIFAPANWVLVVCLFGLVAWPATAATIRARFLAALHDGPAVAARALGATLPSILVRHVLPDLLRPLLRLLALTLGGVLLTEMVIDAYLPTLGTATANWGMAFFAGYPDNTGWWLSFAAGLILWFTALALGLIASGLDSRRVRLLPQAARRSATSPPSAGWPLGTDMLSVRYVDHDRPLPEVRG